MRHCLSSFVIVVHIEFQQNAYTLTHIIMFNIVSCFFLFVYLEMLIFLRQDFPEGERNQNYCVCSLNSKCKSLW